MANKNIKINLDYSQFSGGISECQQKMSMLTDQFKLQQAELGNNASEVDRLTLSQSTLTQKIELQSQVVDKAREKFDALANSEDSTASQVDKAHQAYTRQLTKLTEMVNELEVVNDKLEATSAAEDIVNSSTVQANETFQSLTTQITTTVAIISNLVSASQQAAQAIMDVATKSTEWADDLETLSSQIGVTTTTLQEWAYASSFVDVSVETMQSSLSKLTKQMGEAQNGSSSAQQAFRSLGVSITDSNGNLRSSEAVFYDVIDALGNISNSAERDAASMAVFGKSAQELNTLIEAGSGTLQEYGAEAEALGLVLSSDDVQALASMQDSFDRLNSIMEAAQNRVSAALAPAFAKIADVIANLDPAVLEVVAGMGMLLSVVSSVAPMLSAMATITQMMTMAKVATTVATIAETEAEVGLGVAALATDAALLPQIAIAALLVAAVGGLIYVIKELVDMFTEEADAAERAADSTSKFANSTTGVSKADSSTDGGASGRGHYALGGRVSGRQVWVGEQGAELVELPTGSTVYNHQESRNMTSSSNIFNVTIDAKSVDDFNKVVNVFSGLSQSMNRGGKVNG